MTSTHLQSQEEAGRLLHPLDNVIWEALCTRQARFAESSGQARRFVPEVSPLAGFREPSPEGYESLAGLVPEQATVGLFLDEPYEARSGWSWIAGAPLLQMILENGASLASLRIVSDSEFLELTAADAEEMVELATLTKPGPFNLRTPELGLYIGIRREGRLVAMAGERLKVPGYTEVSAVCTHPEHAGRGYARILMSEFMRRIVGRGETAFLHVREDNVRAIAIYQRLGFKTRKRGHYAVLRKNPGTFGAKAPSEK
jgi:ribosomal protein S18 acetylase RimI-like enzyme